MLRLTDDSGSTRSFYVVDVHHHLGKEDRAKNLQPSAPGGSYFLPSAILYGIDFKKGLLRQMHDEPDRFAYRPPDPDTPLSIISSHPAIEALGELPGNPVPDGSWLIDRFAAFPMWDSYRGREVPSYASRGLPTPTYAASNDKVAQIVHRFPHSLRFDGWARVDPKEAGAVDELARARGIGLRGLKLHPRSDQFTIDSDEVCRVIEAAAALDMPVLFHTSFLSDVRQIRDAANRVVEAAIARSAGPDTAADAVGRIRLVVGHAGWHASPELYRLLRHPCLFADLTGIKGDAVGTIIREFASAQVSWDDVGFAPSPDGWDRALKERLWPTASEWSLKLMFGTDFPFLDHLQAIDLVSTLLSRTFPGGPRELGRVLGGNAMRLMGRAPPQPPWSAGGAVWRPVPDEEPRSRLAELNSKVDPDASWLEIEPWPHIIGHGGVMEGAWTARYVRRGLDGRPEPARTLHVLRVESGPGGRVWMA